MKEDPPLSFKCKDKFLVQSTIITPEKENLPPNDLWTSTPGDEATRVHQQKLKVVYLPAQGTVPEEDEGDQAHQSSMISEGESGMRHYDTVRQHPSSNGHSLGDGITGIPVFDNPPRAHTPDHADYIHAHEEAHDSAPEPIPSPAASPIKPTYNANVGVGSVAANPNVSYDHTGEYAAKLAEANAEISRLQVMLANSNTMAARRRTVFSDDGTSVQDAMTDGGVDDSASVIGTAVRPDGVPLNVVAILSVLVFVVTYLFF
ncbi:hypothetical protein CPB86DRAFT_732978 [Serendipita vermifera]|nr:hypothetical protein CPB86DRAFT_732978 [Serendipita vermifera]